jgi:excisionase family DNA binding protein
MEDKAFLRARDVAHILDCSPDDLYPLIYNGALNASKVGRLWKFRLEDVMDYKKRVNRRTPGKTERGKVNSKQPGMPSKEL